MLFLFVTFLARFQCGIVLLPSKTSESIDNNWRSEKWLFFGHPVNRVFPCPAVPWHDFPGKVLLGSSPFSIPSTGDKTIKKTENRVLRVRMKYDWKIQQPITLSTYPSASKLERYVKNRALVPSHHDHMEISSLLLVPSGIQRMLIQISSKFNCMFQAISSE